MVVYGEGEYAFKMLLYEYLNSDFNPSNVPALSFKSGSTLIINEKNAPFLRPADIPRIFKSRVLRSIKKEIYYESSRGCPNSCKYCSNCLSPVRLLPIDRVEEDLASVLNSEHISHILFTDSALDINRKRFVKILEILAKHNKRGITSGGFLNLNHFDDDMLLLMKRAHFRDISIGVESVSDKSLANIGRKFLNIEKLHSYIRITNDPWTRTNFTTMYILPGDEYDDFRNTLQACINAGLHDLYSNRMLILPGTHYYRHSEEYGLFRDMEPPHLLHSCNSFSEDDLRKADRLVSNLKVLLLFIKKPDVEFIQSRGIDLLDVAENIHRIFPEWHGLFDKKSVFDIEVNISPLIHKVIGQLYNRFIDDPASLHFALALLSMRMALYKFYIESPSQGSVPFQESLRADVPMRLRGFQYYTFPYSIESFLLKPAQIPPPVHPAVYPTMFLIYPSGNKAHPLQPSHPVLLKHICKLIETNATIDEILSDPRTKELSTGIDCLTYLTQLYENGLFRYMSD